jgi:hypothetical protein
MADDQQVRGTSAAKNVDGLAQQESVLDRARALKEQFNRAASHQEQQQSKETEQSQSGVQQASMTKEDAPVLRPTPTGPMRQGPDRAASTERLQKAHDSEAIKLEAARKALETIKSRQGNSHDLDRDRER